MGLTAVHLPTAHSNDTTLNFIVPRASDKHWKETFISGQLLYFHYRNDVVAATCNTGPEACPQSQSTIPISLYYYSHNFKRFRTHVL